MEEPAAIPTCIMQTLKATTAANPKAKLKAVTLSDFSLDKQNHPQLPSNFSS